MPSKGQLHGDIQNALVLVEAQAAKPLSELGIVRAKDAIMCLIDEKMLDIMKILGFMVEVRIVDLQRLFRNYYNRRKVAM